MLKMSNSMQECVKSPTLEVIRPKQVIISRANPHFTSQFCKVELGPAISLIFHNHCKIISKLQVIAEKFTQYSSNTQSSIAYLEYIF